MKGSDFTKPIESKSRLRLLTIRQAAKLIDGLTEYRIRKLCAEGELPCLKLGNRKLINEQTLIDYVANLSNPKGAKEND